MSFVKDIAFGNKWQAQWVRHHSDTAASVTTTSGKFSAYDVLIDGVKLEFKAETLIEKYGNICIEHACSAKPSGINVTEADFYVILSIVDGAIKEYWKIPVSVLKEKIAGKEYHRDTRGGNGWKAQMYLFKKDVFEAWKGV